MKLRDAAEQAGARPETLRRWAKSGVIPQMDGQVDD
jgi:predicted site-specific integrase-resolvase